METLRETSHLAKGFICKLRINATCRIDSWISTMPAPESAFARMQELPSLCYNFVYSSDT